MTDADLLRLRRVDAAARALSERLERTHNVWCFCGVGELVDPPHEHLRGCEVALLREVLR